MDRGDTGTDLGNPADGKQKMKNDVLKKYIKNHIDNIDDNQLLLFIYKLVINLMQ